jgi:hypothetical protein
MVLTLCTIGECWRPVLARSMCPTHYARWWRTGDPENSHQGDPAFKTPKPVNRKPKLRTDGYRSVYEPSHPLAHADGYVLEHRKIVYDAGIPVPDGFHVHHLNGDKLDNRLENLEVISATDHARHHALEDGTINQFGAWKARATRGQTCSSTDCDRPAKANGMCWGHSERARAASAPSCSIEWCDGPARKRGLCIKHYSRLRVNGDPLLIRGRWGMKRESAPAAVGLSVPETGNAKDAQDV